VHGWRGDEHWYISFLKSKYRISGVQKKLSPLLTVYGDLCGRAAPLHGRVGRDARVVCRVLHPRLEDEQVSGGGLDKVGVVCNLDSVLEPVGHVGLGFTRGGVAAELALTADAKLLVVGWGVEFAAKVWGKERRKKGG
jgi:hypothetical protein